MRYLNRAATFCALAFVAVMASPPSVQAQPFPAPVPGPWNPFEWVAGPGAWQSDSPFVLSSDGPLILDVTDAFAPGDRFEIWVNGTTLVGTTSQVNTPANYIADPNAAFAHPGFSSGTFTLPPGTHSITFKVIQIADGAPNGAGFWRVAMSSQTIDLSEVPEPGTMTMAALGLAGMAYGGYRRWRRKEQK
jgi:hypothetical protein